MTLLEADLAREDIAVVTGASRGIGKGVALALGAAGATVYVTGRTLRADDGPFGSIEETAEAVDAAGGAGIAVQCDHAYDDQVAALFARVEREAGRLDLLVNNATRLPCALAGEGGFWERSLELADMFDVGLRSAYVASWHAARLMAPRRRGLIASISFYGAVSYFAGPAYGAQKAAIDKMMHDMAIDLAPHAVAAVAIWPGLVGTEMVLSRWRGKQGAEESLAAYETPRFTGLVIDALLHDPELLQRSGSTIVAADYARANGIRDADGKQPPSYGNRMGIPHRYFTPAGAT